MGKSYNSIVTFVIVVLFTIRAVEGGNDASFISQTLIPGRQHVTDEFQKMFRQNLAILRQGPGPKQQGPPRQQYKGIPAGLDDFLKMQRVGSDTFLEPYWHEGEWVFQRETFTPRPPRYLAHYPKLKPSRLQACIESCPRIYEGYGPICAHFVSMTNGMLRLSQFENICHLKFENCLRGTTKHGNDDAPWKPVFQGSCHYRWTYQRVTSNILKNAKKHLERLTKDEQ